MLKAYFEPLDLVVLENGGDDLPKDSFGKHISAYTQPDRFPDLEGVKIAIFGVGDDRGAGDNTGCAKGMDEIREKLYKLKLHQSPVSVVDFGNLRPGNTIDDTYAAISVIVSELIPLKIIPVIIGGSHDLTYGHYSAYKRLEQIINIVSIDSKFDLGQPDDELNSETFLGKIILEQPNYLFNFSNIGYQTYFVGTEGVELMKKLFFDTFRLGQVRGDIQETEPIVRNADMLTVDISSIRQSDAPGHVNASPNGFYGEEICQIMLYSGVSDKVSGIGFYEYNPTYDRNGQTAHLIAQMLWFFIEGVSNRKIDTPSSNPSSYITYRVAVKNVVQELIFIKSTKTDRWWLKLPMEAGKNRYISHHLVPCSYRDYQQACNDEMPDRLWNALQKIV